MSSIEDFSLLVGCLDRLVVRDETRIKLKVVQILITDQHVLLSVGSCLYAVSFLISYKGLMGRNEEKGKKM